MTTLGKLIGIVGYAGSGKTTVTHEAISCWNGPPKTVQRNFSRPIVEALAVMGVPRELLDDKARWNDPLEILCGQTIRHAAQTLGTEWGRCYIGQEFWTGIALTEANAMRDKGRHVIIDNVRFPSEMQAMRKAGATFVAMYGTNTPIDVQHESEKHIATLQKRCEFGILNNGTFNEAVEKMRKIIVDIIDG